MGVGGVACGVRAQLYYRFTPGAPGRHTAGTCRAMVDGSGSSYGAIEQPHPHQHQHQHQHDDQRSIDARADAEVEAEVEVEVDGARYMTRPARLAAAVAVASVLAVAAFASSSGQDAPGEGVEEGVGEMSLHASEARTTQVGQATSTDTCVGFEECPTSFPMPYDGW